MKCELRFKLWCVLEDAPEKEERKKEISAASNEDAIRKANKFLEGERAGTVISYAPSLYCEERPIASSTPSNPLGAHRLVWDNIRNAAIA